MMCRDCFSMKKFVCFIFTRNQQLMSIESNFTIVTIESNFMLQ